MTAGTYTERDGTKTEFIFAFNRSGKIENVDFEISELGLGQSAYVYDYFAKTARRLGPHASYSAQLNKKDSAYYVVAPVGKSGIAFLGDEHKFVGTGKQRIDTLQDQPGKLTVGVVLAENEKSAVLHGYSATAPGATVLGGVAGPVKYDPSTGHFTIEVEPNSEVDRSTGDPVRKVSVIFKTSAK